MPIRQIAISLGGGRDAILIYKAGAGREARGGDPLGGNLTRPFVVLFKGVVGSVALSGEVGVESKIAVVAEGAARNPRDLIAIKLLIIS